MVYATIRQHGDVLKTEKSNGDVNSPVNEGVNEGVNTIGQGAMMTYSLIQETPGINTPQLVILSGKSDATIERHIAELKKNINKWIRGRLTLILSSLLRHAIADASIVLVMV